MLTKLNDKEIFLNYHVIQIIEQNPDTTITLTNGHKIIVKESADDIVEKIVEFERNINS